MAKYYQRRERSGEVTVAADEHDLPMDSTIQEGLEEDQDQQLLALAVRQLDPVSQDVVILHYWGGFTLAQVAVVVGSNEVNTRARLHRARRKLAGFLEAPDVRSRLSREGRGTLDDLRMELGQIHVVDGADERGDA